MVRFSFQDKLQKHRVDIIQIFKLDAMLNGTNQIICNRYLK